MGRLRRVFIGIAVVAVVPIVLAGTAVPGGALAHRGTPNEVASKGKKPKKAVSACKLLTIAEITQALGVAPIVPAKSDSAGECDYASAASDNFIYVSLRPLVTPALWKQAVQGGGATIAVAGIGDEAYRSPNNATIMVRKGKQTLRIDQFVAGLPEAAIESLGKAATSRL